MAGYDEEERYLLDTLDGLRRSYEKAAKPYIDRLVRIRNARPAQPMIVSIAEAKAAGLID